MSDPTRRERLTRPTGGQPDAFYKLVGQAYTEAAQSTNAPAPAIAAEAGVPVGTARRWVLEARRRGHIPPAARVGTIRPDAYQAVADELQIPVTDLLAAVRKHSPRSGLRPRAAG